MCERRKKTELKGRVKVLKTNLGRERLRHDMEYAIVFEKMIDAWLEIKL